MLFKIVLGDLSGDGHKQNETFLVNIHNDISNKKLIKNYNKNIIKIGFSIEDIANGYEESSVTEDQLCSLQKAGLKTIINHDNDEIIKYNNAVDMVNEINQQKSYSHISKAINDLEKFRLAEYKEYKLHDDYFDDIDDDEEDSGKTINPSNKTIILEKPEVEIETFKKLKYKEFYPENITLTDKDKNYYETVVLRLDDMYYEDYLFDGSEPKKELVKIFMFMIGNGIKDFSWNFEEKNIPILLGGPNSLTGHNAGYGMFFD